MHDLMNLLESVPTNSCSNREEAKRDIESAISMSSQVVIDNFISSWVLTSQDDLAKMSTQDMQYRQFLLEFEEKYRG